jgi:hypothetical protein
LSSFLLWGLNHWISIDKGALMLLRNLAGDGLFTSSDTDASKSQAQPSFFFCPNTKPSVLCAHLDWGKAHRILIPAFNAKSIRAYFGDMVDQSQELMKKLSTYSPQEKVDFRLV